VEDLLTTAGVGEEIDDDEFEDDIDTRSFEMDDSSPSVVRKAANLDDESF